VTDRSDGSVSSLATVVTDGSDGSDGDAQKSFGTAAAYRRQRMSTADVRAALATTAARRSAESWPFGALLQASIRPDRLGRASTSDQDHQERQTCGVEPIMKATVARTDGLRRSRPQA
jgi:hypothetical protein